MAKKTRAGATSDAASSGEMPKLHLSGRYVVDPESKGFAARLKQLRQMRGLTLDALSLVTKAVDPSGQGISRVSLSRYESGSEPGIRELRLLSLALRKSLVFLMYEDQDDPMARASRPNLEELIDDLVDESLKARKLIPSGPSPNPMADSDEYKALLVWAKKKAKE